MLGVFSSSSAFRITPSHKIARPILSAAGLTGDLITALNHPPGSIPAEPLVDHTANFLLPLSHVLTLPSAIASRCLRPAGA